MLVKVHLSHQTKSQLSARTRCTSNFHAAQVIAAYVLHELAAIEGIERGLAAAAAAAARVIPHEEVMRHAQELIKKVSAKS